MLLKTYKIIIGVIFIKKILSLLIILSVLAGIFSACGFLEGDQSGGAVKLSEVMASNNGVLADESGDYPDWIELYNSSDKDIDLEGYSLTDKVDKRDRFIFPSFTIKSGEYLVIYASGKNTIDSANRIIHLPYSINAQKEDVLLYDKAGELLGHIQIENMSENISCGLDQDGNTVFFKTPTPGKANSEITDAPSGNVPSGEINSDIKIYINEYATKDSITLADETGEYSSWAELYNYGEEEVSLAGFSLSDNPGDPAKWTFPNVTIPAGEYLIVFMSGSEKAYTEGGELHASFNLSGKEEKLSLFTSSGALVDSLPVYDLTSNLTYGRTAADPSSLKFFPKATPGTANTITGFDQIESAKYPQNKEIAFSEVAAVNTTFPEKVSSKKQPAKRYDYIELYNPSEHSLNLKGYTISKGSSAENSYTFSDISVDPKSYFIIFCGAEENKTENGYPYIKIGLGRYGESLYIKDPGGTVVDSMKSGQLSEGTSSGRISMTDPDIYYFNSQTAGKANPAEGLKGHAPVPVFSKASGYADKGETISITCPGAVIRYTTDGSAPTESSPVYDGNPIALSQTVTIRARAYMDGRLPSQDSAGSYIIGRKHNLPVFFLSSDPDGLFGYENGILANGPGYTGKETHDLNANYSQDWERPAHVEYIDENGVSQLEFNAGIKVFGQFSRDLPQKSLSVNLRDKYGPKEICYPFFENGATNVFSELVLRNSGQDNGNAHIRDAFCAMAVKGQMDLDIMDYRPVVVYINGEYYGLYDLRDKICEDYVANLTGADPDNIDMIKGNSAIMSGDLTAYRQLLDYVNSHDLSIEANYKYVESIVDIEELCNWWITESFFNNTDTGNIKFYRERKDGAKWRWVLFDMDWALFPSTYEWNMVEEIFNPAGHGVGKMFDTDLMVALLANKDFRENFIRTYGKHLKTTFSQTRLLEIFDSMIAEIDEEMKYHIERWNSPSSYERWKSNVSRLREIISKKTEMTRNDVIKTFSNPTVSHIRKYLMSPQEITALLDG